MSFDLRNAKFLISRVSRYFESHQIVGAAKEEVFVELGDSVMITCKQDLVGSGFHLAFGNSQQITECVDECKQIIVSGGCWVKTGGG